MLKRSQQSGIIFLISIIFLIIAFFFQPKLYYDIRAAPFMARICSLFLLFICSLRAFQEWEGTTYQEMKLDPQGIGILTGILIIIFALIMPVFIMNNSLNKKIYLFCFCFSGFLTIIGSIIYKKS
ncbi:MAG: hypothetical protein ACP6IY_04695 [Promethearchaeia archaeon]